MRFEKAIALVAAALATSCGDPQVSAPVQAPAIPRTGEAATTTLQRLECSGRVDTKVVRCGAAPSAASADVIIGGQLVYVTLTSTNVNYDVPTHIFSFDVSVTNLIPQAFGTNDGATPDGTGVRVFFHSGPDVTGGTGTATVANPSGTGTFTNTNQPYFQYGAPALGSDGILSQNEVSSTMPWQLDIDPAVTTFAFSVYVSTNVHYPNGYFDVTSPSPYLLQLGTQTVTAVQRSAVGNVVVGAAPTFSSTATAVATVDPSTGDVTGVTPGFATITVTSGAITGAVNVQVCPNLAVGEVYTTSGTGANSVCFGGAAGTTEYTILPLNTAVTTLSLTVKGTGLVAVTGPPTPDRIPSSILRTSDAVSAEVAAPGDPLNGVALSAMHHNRKAASAQPLQRPSGPSASDDVATTESSNSAGAMAFMRAPSADTIGDIRTYNSNSACSGSPSIRTGTVRSLSAHAIVVADNANPSGGFNTAQYDSIGLEFDSIAFKVDSQYFSPPTDIDGNGRIILFYTRALNELSPPASASFVIGFFASKDVFGTDDCSNSNGAATIGAEILYMAVPDPSGTVNSNVRTLASVRGFGVRIAGHELQHLINGMARAYVTGASFFEQGWLNEALSTVAEELMFYRTSGGLAPGMNITLPNLTGSGSARIAAFNTYENNNFTNLRGWLQRPDTVHFVNGANSLAGRGFGAAFLRYAADRVNAGDESFLKSMVMNNLEGLPNIQNAIGGVDPYDWIRDFQVALYADDNAFTVGSPYATKSWNYRSIYPALSTVFPLLARPLINPAGLTLSYAAAGSTSFIRFGVPASSFATIATLASGAPPPTTVRVTFVRTK